MESLDFRLSLFNKAKLSNYGIQNKSAMEYSILR